MYHWHEQMERARAAKARRGNLGKARSVRVLTKDDLAARTYCPMRDAIERMRHATSDALEQYRFDVFLAPEFMPFAGEWVQL